MQSHVHHVISTPITNHPCDVAEWQVADNSGVLQGPIGQVLGIGSVAALGGPHQLWG